jgi:phosphatidylglycerophosphatase A
MPPETNPLPEEIVEAIADASPQGPGTPPPPLTFGAFFAYVIGTVGGLGYIKPGPGTWGSFAGLIIYAFIAKLAGTWTFSQRLPTGVAALAFGVTVIVSLLGVWAASRIEDHASKKDPQFVIVDEVSGQMLAYSAALAPLNWKYLLLGFILFRVFDITKPVPARQAENLPGGWGIMADDWVAALFAAALLWVARGFGM